MANRFAIWLAVSAMVAGVSGAASADKIIMKDGKIYDGHIMGETNFSVLLSSNPIDPTPRFVPLNTIRTIVRESRPPEPPSDEDYRFPTAELMVTGRLYAADRLSLNDSAGLHAAGGFRLFRFLEVDAELDWVPNTGGQLAVTDGTDTRRYEDFYTYSGGFSVRLYPFFRQTRWPVHPYGLVGYHWDRLAPKSSGDWLSGYTILGGAGISYPVTERLSWETRMLYRRTLYDHIQFLSREGDLDQAIHLPDYEFSTGMAYHW
ncbi:MAG TPA: hypothetical protein VMU17_02175 [Elusimicrobiota bacterium]|nr:hypothetical protein [Elusimicrobiota bacterium]